MGSMVSFVDELVKINAAAAVAEAGKKAVPFLKAHGKTMGLVGAGAAGYHLGSKEIEKYRLGRQVYDQMQAREG